MNGSKPWWLILVGLPTLCVVACDDSTSPTEPIVEETVEVPRVTETFPGSLMLGESSCHAVIATQTGDVDMTITDLGPLTTLTVGMGIGFPDSSALAGCALFAADQSVRLGDVLLSSQLAAAEYCVCVYDVGNIFAGETVTYTLDVTHP